MSFDYGEYLFQNFWLPISILSFFFLGGSFAFLFMKPVKTAYEKENEPEKTLTKKLLGGLLAVITFGFLLYINLRTLFGLGDRKSTRLNSSHPTTSRMPSSA